MNQATRPLQDTTGNLPHFTQTMGVQAELAASDNPSLMTQFSSSHYTLQPTYLLGVQPSNHGQEMVYPGPDSHNPSLSRSFPTHNVVGPNIKRDPDTSKPSADGRNAPMELAPPVKVESPVIHRQAPAVDVLAQYDLPYGYGASNLAVAGGEQVTNMQGPRTEGALLHARTTKRGPFKDHDERLATAYTRRIGSCIRCRMQRIRVSHDTSSSCWSQGQSSLTHILQCKLDAENEDGPCQGCKKVATNRIWRLSCLRWKITDVRLYKPGQVKGHEWTNRWRDSVVDNIGSWSASDIRTIRVTEGYTGQFVELRVRRFQPQEGDKLQRSWVTSRGESKSITIPPYAVVDLETAKSSFEKYIKKGLLGCCKKLVGRNKKLLWRTYDQAMKLMASPLTEEKEKELIHSTLILWMSVRLTTKSFEIVGNDTLGMPHNIIDDEENALHGKVPLPPVMGAQIDAVLIHQIQPALRRKTLEELQKMTQEKKQKTWLTTYIVTFILLHNIALITKHDAEYARKHGMKVCPRLRNGELTMF